jgi:hypothetical protein
VTEPLLTRLGKLNEAIAPATSRERAFGVVFDSTSRHSDRPIALVVGINYGQLMTSGDLKSPTHDRIHYAKRISEIASHLQLPLRDHAVVLWNFYPFLTELPWTEEVKSTRHEAELLFKTGYVDPIGTFEQVYHSMRPDLLIFHGNQSAVPILAQLAVRRVGARALLLNNLSRGAQLHSITEIGTPSSAST